MLSGLLPVKEVEPKVVGKVVVEEKILAGDYVLAQQEMVVEEGVLGSQQLVGPCVVMVAERVASFLLLLDGRLPADSHIFIDKEASWLRNSMDLKPVGTQYISLEALLDGSWRNRKGEEVTFLIQGSHTFCAKAIVAFSGVGALSASRWIVASGGNLPAKAASLFDLAFTTVHHHLVGGVTSTKVVLACSKHLLGGKKLVVPPSSIRRSLLKQLKGDVYGAKCPSPPTVPVPCSESPYDPRLPVHPSALLDKFFVPTVYRNDGWVVRKLTVGEIGAALDLPVETTPSLVTAAKFNSSLLRDVVQLPPVKVIQVAVDILMGASQGSKSVDPKLLGHSAPRLALSSFEPRIRAKAAEARDAKATKADDAATNVAVWDDRAVCPPVDSDPIDYQTWPYLVEPSQWLTTVGVCNPLTHGVIFQFLRQKMAGRFAKNVTTSFRGYLRDKYSLEDLDKARDGVFTSDEIEKDLIGGKDAIGRARGASFWDWSMGSSPFFWRWQKEVRKDMRDGTPCFVKGKLPSFKEPQRMPADKSIAQKIMDKVNKVRFRSYIVVGLVLSLTSYFHVPKGEDDIRIVYDLTACGLNDALWAPTFWMPTVLSVLDCATHSSWFGDVDAGEMFLNYWLDEAIRPYAGVDVSWASESPGTRWERWNRCAMGMLPSPWVTTRLFAWAMEIIKGDHTCKANPFYWSSVEMNCPGSPNYDPSMPRAYKWNDQIMAIACDCRTFVDDLRAIGPTLELCLAATHRVETIMSYLGLQDSTRKRRPASQVPGEWTGSITLALEGIGLFVTVAQSKWDKAKGYIRDLLAYFASPEDLPDINLKELESKVGFLVHLSMSYPLMKPFLRGIYLTLNAWRPQRDEHGWKMSNKIFSAFMSNMRRNGAYADVATSEDQDAPTMVKAVPVLFQHLTALFCLFEASEPALRLIRGSSIVEVCYIFGDASGEGFGSAWRKKRKERASANEEEPGDGCLAYRFGVWGKEGVDTSSNYRELRNLVETLEVMGIRGDLEGRELFLFTDNMVSESIASRGSSTSQKLYELILRVYKLEMNHLCRIQFVHVAGTRMIKSGVDGLSRGDMYEGVMKGESMLSFVPLHKGAFEVWPALQEWIESWAINMGNEVEVLSPEDWFVRGHDIDGSTENCDGMWLPSYRKGTMIWAPPPGAARQASEELRQARQKRQDSFHVFVCPRLLYDEWRKHQFKAADLMMEIKAGVSEVWPKEMHETLIICLYFPFINRDPWELKRTRMLVDLESKMFKLLKRDHTAAGNLLSKFLLQAQRFDSMSLRDLRRVLH